MSNENDMQLQKKNKLGLILLIAVPVIVVLIIGFRLFGGFDGSAMINPLDEHITLGDKYLAELNYEEAVAELRAAIEIDPTNEIVRGKLENAYVAWGEDLSDKKQYETAITKYDEAKAILGDTNKLVSSENSVLADWTLYSIDNHDYQQAVQSMDMITSADENTKQGLVDTLTESLKAWAKECINNKDYEQAKQTIELLKQYDAESADDLRNRMEISIAEDEFRETALKWLDSTDISFTVDNIVLGESTINAAKSAYSGRGDYKSNPMNDNAYDTVYSMPYKGTNPDSNGGHGDMEFGYLFSAPIDNGIIDDIYVSDPSLLLLGSFRVGDSADVMWDYLGIKPDDRLKDMEEEVVSNDGKSLLIGKGIIRYICNKGYLQIYIDDDKVFSFTSGTDTERFR